MNFKEDVLRYLNIKEEDDFEETEETSCKTEKCPKCGKNPCKCKCSITTKTTGGDDGDDSYGKASVALAGDFKKIKRNKEAEKDCKKLPDDHTNGRNSCVNTMKESFRDFANGVNGTRSNIISEEVAETSTTKNILDYYNKLFK